MTVSDYNITILGGSFAGLSIAHYLLRHTIPALEASNESRKYKVTLITPSTHFFFKVGAPRLCSPQLASIDKAFIPIDDGFKNYPSDRFHFVQGEATALDHDQKTISVTLTDSSETVTAAYDTLVLATGTTSTSALWTLHGSHLTSRAAFKDLLLRLPTAHSITIVGGGPAGVETAGELAAQYGRSKAITLLSGTTRLLHRLPPRAGRDAAAYLARLGVTVRHDLRLSSSSAIDAATGRTRLALSDGSTQTVDLFIDATGGKPNSAFLPAAWLTASGHVATDGGTLRATAAGTRGVYAVGDVASYSLGSIFDVNNAIAPLASSILVDLAAGTASAATQKIHKQSRTTTQLVPIGPNGGVGLLFGWRVPSWFVWLIKARTYFFEKAEALVMGKDWAKA